jgi:hypothetical protein
MENWGLGGPKGFQGTAGEAAYGIKLGTVWETH